MPSKAIVVVFAVVLLASCDTLQSPQQEAASAKAAVGRKIFFDTRFSEPVGQSCASCHAPATGFSDPNHAAVSPGARTGYFAYRNAPSIAYASYTPLLRYDAIDSTWIGGYFLDGRAKDLADQAMQPFLNPLEMNAQNASTVAERLRSATYYNDFVRIYGNSGNGDTLFHQMADALAAFEQSSELHPFTSKFDYYLAGRVTLTDQEYRGFQLFSTRAKCANCHSVDRDRTSGKVLFTDFSYDNLGVPRNPQNPYYFMPPTRNPHGEEFIDEGLARTLHTGETRGQFKVPSLRNVAVSAPYFHNGCFTDLKQVVHWYNVRDSATRAGAYAPPEVPENVNREELGDLHLTTRDEEDIVAFLNTLTDGYK